MSAPALKDKAVKVTTALPNGAAAVNGTAIDTGCGANGDQLADVEFLLSAPALTVTEQPDDKNMTYDIEHSVDNSTFTKLLENVIVQTGAGGAGAAAATSQFRLPADANRYIRANATGDATGDSTTADMTLELVA